MEKILVRLKGMKDILEIMACDETRKDGYAFILMAQLLDECIQGLEEDLLSDHRK